MVGTFEFVDRPEVVELGELELVENCDHLAGQPRKSDHFISD